LKLEELAEGMKEKVSTEEEDLREAPLESLWPPVLERLILEEGVASHRC
jgi:hypothetical protein